MHHQILQITLLPLILLMISYRGCLRLHHGEENHPVPPKLLFEDDGKSPMISHSNSQGILFLEMHQNAPLGNYLLKVLNLLGGQVGLGNLSSDQIMFTGIGTPQTFFSNLIPQLLVLVTKGLVLQTPCQ